ncbi:MAG: hypothetical protein JO261_01095 [Alphaproteobacteria bacterium]|nr:hypothetical protein [Alphaproteobacteria bacterium]MBV9692272.1 hypothetical protein [Alphaproteobacteria bacterium]
MVDPLHLFSAGERERIRAAVEEARHGTRAHFSLVAAPASDHYSWFPVVWAAIAALVATGVLAIARPHWSLALGFAVDAGLFVTLSLVFDWWPIRVRLVPPHFKRMALAHAAGRAFAAQVLAHPGGTPGLMLYVSLAERHLEIIASRDAHAAVPEQRWSDIVRAATGTMRARGRAEGLVAAIQACGATLAKAFPVA